MVTTLIKMMEARSAYRGTVSFAVICLLGLLAGSCTSQSVPDDDNATWCIHPKCQCETYPVPQDEYGVNVNEANCVCPEHGTIPPEVTHDTLVLNISFSEPVVLTRDSLPEFRQVIRLNVTGVQYFLPGAFHGFHSVLVLHLKGNFQRVLEADVFEGLTQLTHLIVDPTDRKQIHSLENGSFVGLTKLDKLKLANNSISALETDFFRDLKELTTLDMSENEIAEIQSETFVHLLKLNDLDLTGNVIRLIQRNAFRGLTQLKCLRLGGNKLRGMPEPTFQARPQPSEPSNNHIRVILHDNPLRCGCHLNWTSRWLDDDNKECEGTCSTPPEFHGQTLSAVFGKIGLSKCRHNNSVISVNTSEHVELTCPMGDITWQTPEGYLLKESGDMNDPYLLTSKGSLIIMNASPENSGHYTCMSLESDDSEGYTVEVSVSQMDGGSLSVKEIIINVSVAVAGVGVGVLGTIFAICIIRRCRRNHLYVNLTEDNIHVDEGRNGGGNSIQNQSGVPRGAVGRVHRPMTPQSDDELNGIVYKPRKTCSKVIPKLNDNFITIGTPSPY